MTKTTAGPRIAPLDPPYEPAIRLLIRLVDELHDTCGISDGLWSALAGVYRDDQLLELVIIAGWYRLVSYVINALRIELEPWAARFPPAEGWSR
jgi:hypothetical protein